MIGTEDLLQALNSKVKVAKKTVEVFTHLVQTELNFSAELTPDAAASASFDVLKKNKQFDPRVLRQTLLAQDARRDDREARR
ncbi:MAG: hypothetical protein K1X78_08190 [Verrucomicrobiaceae bacterium]|nr:hypothetical protein [Verrucomicrobiaceae bacterium]